MRFKILCKTVWLVFWMQLSLMLFVSLQVLVAWRNSFSSRPPSPHLLPAHPSRQSTLKLRPSSESQSSPNIQVRVDEQKQPHTNTAWVLFCIVVQQVGLSIAENQIHKEKTTDKQRRVHWLIAMTQPYKWTSSYFFLCPGASSECNRNFFVGYIFSKLSFFFQVCVMIKLQNVVRCVCV